MPHLILSNPTTYSCDYEIYLSNSFNQTYYKQIRITSTNHGAETSNVPAYVVSKTAPNSGTSRYVTGIIDNGMSPGRTYKLYAYAQAQNGIWYLAGSDTITTKTIPANYAIYPCKVMNITQNYTDLPTHYEHSIGYTTNRPYDWPFDDNCGDQGRSYMYCPCDKMEIKKIYGVGGSGTNTIWLRSTSKVTLANGSTDYLVMMVIHPDDDTLQTLYVGQTFTRGQAMFLEGSDGLSYGDHFHISLGLGDMQGTGWTNIPNTIYYVINTTNGPIKPENALYINNSFTTVMSNKGLTFKSL